ncbi:hypothetical protein OESDEN_20514 [Oesophagostomum dentatum]|uniref:SCP domain-containing protein n=1 Tax=Oesophagostomum dentatum TaxID=61180 RepID=A0A0B1S7E5_OESDE|nr:hypothetical protein OESDEN_20514 [Oesophagostomum dentatum]
MFAWLVLFCAISAIQCSVKGGGQSRQQWQAYCPGFPTEKDVLPRDFRDSLARNVLAARNKSMKYDCVLEALASARMLSPQYYKRRTQNMDIVPLEYQEVADLIVFENFTQAAAKEWAPWFRALCHLSSFGCNYAFKPLKPRPGVPYLDVHKITCLFFFTPM